MRIYDKSTYASRVNAKTASMRKAALEMEEEDAALKMHELAVKDDPGWIMAVTRGEFAGSSNRDDWVSSSR